MEETGALVSVLIPSYERPRYLREALASVLAQTHRRLEIIVHDNASPDRPGRHRRRLRRSAHRAAPQQATNLGVAANLAAGLARCTGKYVAILGDDDLWHPEFVAALVRRSSGMTRRWSRSATTTSSTPRGASTLPSPTSSRGYGRRRSRRRPAPPLRRDRAQAAAHLHHVGRARRGATPLGGAAA